MTLNWIVDLDLITDTPYLEAPGVTVGTLEVADDLLGGRRERVRVPGAQTQLLQDLLQVCHLRQHVDLFILKT